MDKQNLSETRKELVTPMTFADAYKTKSLQKSRSSTLGLALLQKEPMTLQKCLKDLESIGTSLETNNVHSFTKMKDLLDSLPRQFNESVTHWVDRRNMDMLQICIVYNKPDIIEIILENYDLFPEGHQPPQNPYAHLAAWMGHRDCLKAVLKHRPGLYFKTTRPQHIIKLHKDIQTEAKKDGRGSVNKYVQKMLKRVGDGPLKAESAWDTLSSRKKSDIDDLDRELSALETKSTAKKVKSKRMTSLSFDVSEAERLKRGQTLQTTGQSAVNSICTQGIAKGEHVITVHDWNFLDEVSAESQGVVKGVGLGVQLLDPEERQEIRTESLRLPKIDDVRTLNIRSQIAMNQRLSDIPESAFSSKSSLDVSVGKSLRNVSQNYSSNVNRFPYSTNERNIKDIDTHVLSRQNHVIPNTEETRTYKQNHTTSCSEATHAYKQKCTNSCIEATRTYKKNHTGLYTEANCLNKQHVTQSEYGAASLKQRNVTNSHNSIMYSCDRKITNSEDGTNPKLRGKVINLINGPTIRNQPNNVESYKKTLPRSRQNNTASNNGAALPKNVSTGNKNNASVVSRSSLGSRSQSSTSIFKKIELGVRTIKKYKDFQVVIDSRKLHFKDDKYLNKTPLTLAAEKGNTECVTYLLQDFLLKQYPMFTSKEPLALATKARSPEAIAILLTGKYSREDYQRSVLLALRDFYPACLAVLLNSDNNARAQMFDGENLFHILYSQSLSTESFRYEMMPEMTRTLINCREDVNTRGQGSSHPMYTLITCAFNIRTGNQCLYYLECLKILLGAKANPHYNELKDEIPSKPTLSLSRQLYYSAIHCIIVNAYKSTSNFEKPYLAKLIMQKFIDCVIANDKTPRRILNDVLFTYMDSVTQLGLDRRVLRSLFRYGANPDYKFEEKYAINRFFDEMIPFLCQFEVSEINITAKLEGLMMVCEAMRPECLHEAFVKFLDDHLLRTPLQAVALTRQFCYQVNREIRNPRSLAKLTGNVIWQSLKRNNINAGKLELDESIIGFVIPS